MPELRGQALEALADVVDAHEQEAALRGALENYERKGIGAAAARVRARLDALSAAGA